jgi:hypothetical protein
MWKSGKDRYSRPTNMDSLDAKSIHAIDSDA